MAFYRLTFCLLLMNFAILPAKAKIFSKFGFNKGDKSQEVVLSRNAAFSSLEAILDPEFAGKVKRCVESICDKPQEQFTAMTSEQSYLEWLNGDGKTDYAQFFNKVWPQIDRIRREKMALANELKRKVKEVDPADLAKQQDKFEMLSDLVNGSDLFNEDIYYEGSVARVKLELLDPNYSDEDKDILEKLYYKFAGNEYYQRNMVLGMHMDMDTYLQNNSYASFDDYFEEQVKLIKSMSEKLPLDIAQRYKSLVDNIRELFGSLGLPENFLRNALVTQVARYYGEINFLINSTNFNDDEIRLLTQSRRKEIKESIDKVSKINPDIIYDEETWKKRCEDAFRQAYEWSVTIEEINETKEVLKKSKIFYLNWLREKFSKDSFQVLEKAVANYKVNFPLTLIEYTEQVEKNIERAYVSGDLSEDINYFSSVAHNKEDSSLIGICNDYIQRPLSDSADSNGINLSTFSVKNHSFGKGIFLHEMTHAISTVIYDGEISEDSLVGFKDMRSCASKYHDKELSDNIGVGGAFINFDGDTHWSEEDTADLVASAVTRAGESGKIDNYFCVMVSAEKQYSKDDLKFGSDTHSPNLLRVMTNELRINGELDESCQSLAKINMCI